MEVDLMITFIFQSVFFASLACLIRVLRESQNLALTFFMTLALVCFMPKSFIKMETLLLDGIGSLSCKPLVLLT